MIGRYQSAAAFRAALEECLKRIARERGVDIMRLRRQVAFDRLLARLFAQAAPPWLLKGGYAFELRLGAGARATRDLDLSIPHLDMIDASGSQGQSQSAVIRDSLQDAAEKSMDDAFVFRIGAPMTDLDAAPYGGARYPIEARLDNRVFARFHLDVGIGDAVITPPESLIGQDILAFAGIPSVRVAALAREQQFAEKIHAYTLPRDGRMNTRVKDLVDLVLLISSASLDPKLVLMAIRATFSRRATHAIPRTLEPAPEAWRAPYAALAGECGLSQADIDVAFNILTIYWAALALDT